MRPDRIGCHRFGRCEQHRLDRHRAAVAGHDERRCRLRQQELSLRHGFGGHDRRATGDEAKAHERLARGIPLKRIGEPDDVAYAVLYLASDESKFVTGSEFKIDGGMTAQ